MTKNNKLSVIVGVLSFFIIVLVALLIYTTTIYKDSKTLVSADSTASRVSADSTASRISANSSAVASTSAADKRDLNNTQETIDLKLYLYNADDYENAKEIKTVKTDKKLYTQNISDAINKLLSETGLRINKAVIDGNSIVLDIPKAVANKFNEGSTGGIVRTNILAMTILNLPNIDKLQITVDGKQGVYADHFSFNGVFTKSQDGKKYIFTESKDEGNELSQ